MLQAINSLSLQNLPSLANLASRHAATHSQLAKSMAKLGSGVGILHAGDGPSDLAMSESLRSLISRYEAASGNVQQAMDYTATMDSHLQSTHDVTGRMQELAIAANDGTRSDVDRAALQAEFEDLQGYLQDMGSGSSALAKFNGQALLQGDSVTVAVGPDSGQSMSLVSVDLTTGSTTEIGMDSQGNPVTFGAILASDGSGLRIDSQEDAQHAIEGMNLATDYISSTRAKLGAQENRLGHTLSGMRDAEVNAVASESRTRDLDVAKEMISFVKLLALGQATRGVLGSSMTRIMGQG